MEEVEINCTKVANMDPKIALRNNWSCRSQRVYSGFEDGEEASGRVIIARGHGFEPSMKLGKSYLNSKDVNWSRHVE